MAVAGMPLSPDEARQVGLHIADRRAARYARGSDVGGACRGFCASGIDPWHARYFVILSSVLARYRQSSSTDREL